MRSLRSSAPATPTATEIVAGRDEAWAKRRQRTFLDAERGLVFGRLFARRASPKPLYVGRRWVHDERARPARRQLAGAGRAAVLYRDARRAAAA